MEEEKIPKIKSITKLYYSNPLVQKAILDFSQDREVVPRYYEGFGKRPDTLQYTSDIINLVNKGATSFHSSEELWNDPLKINSDMPQDDLSNLRKGWDLLLDIDSPYIDLSKIAAKLIIAALEYHGIKNYGIKFSGSKGMHIIVSGKAFPDFYDGQETRKMFPEWPRAISEYLMDYIRQDYNKQAAAILTDFSAIKRRTNLSKEDLMEKYCTNCNRPAKKGAIIQFKCTRCKTEIERRDYKKTSRVLSCINPNCGGELQIASERSYYYCENCKSHKNKLKPLDSENNPEYFEKEESASAEKVASLDLVLVAPRHLFRMPFSLHEKTALSSVVITKEQIDSFSPRDARPLSVKIMPFLPANHEGEAKNLLSAALEWKKTHSAAEEEIQKKKYTNYEKVDFAGVTEDIFPDSIKKLLKGLEEGKKRGLFILITFLRSLNFSPDYLNSRIREWNKLNKPPLKEGYVKSQIDWHLKQKKQILPPNYNNDSFYKDLKLIDKKPDVKNPLVEVMRRLKKQNL